ncbi:DUF4860 domain-containing protein [Lachnospiraceae bacterium NSJ-143]|nr:DUF4860 domain-containing protein [Lachnospiraceae bacterium NSJ-143]
MKKTYFDTVFTLLLFCVFIFASAAMLLCGIKVYENTENDTAKVYGTQTALSYIANKVRQNDCGNIRIETLPTDTRALAMDCEIDGESYTTYLYYYGGNLCEIFSPADIIIEADSGIPVIGAESLDIDYTDGIIKVTVKESHGFSDFILLSPVSETEEV